MNRQEQNRAAGAGLRRCSAAELDQPESPWNRAAAATAQADPFCCRTEWSFSYHEAFAPDRRLHLLEAGGSVLAFAEVEHALGTLLEPLESHWLFGCPLLGERAAELLDAFLRARRGRRAPFVLLGGLLPGLAARLAAQLGARGDVRALEPRIMRSAALAGGLDGFLARRSAPFRRKLRQAARRARERGVTFERRVTAGDAEAAAVYARMLAVERASWKGIGKCGMAEPPAREFYAALLRRLSRSGAGRVMFARQGERDLGFIFGGLAGAVYRGQQFSYAEDWSAASIGNLLQLEQIRWLCEEGVARYDMGPLMDYKRHWTEIESRIDVLLLRPR